MQRPNAMTALSQTAPVQPADMSDRKRCEPVLRSTAANVGSRSKAATHHPPSNSIARTAARTTPTTPQIHHQHQQVPAAQQVQQAPIRFIRRAERQAAPGDCLLARPLKHSPAMRNGITNRPCHLPARRPRGSAGRELSIKGRAVALEATEDEWMQQRSRVRLEPGGLNVVCSFCSAAGHDGNLDPVGLSSCNGGLNWAVKGQPHSGVEVQALNGRVITWVEAGVTVHAVATGRDQTGDGNQQRVDPLVPTSLH